MRDPVGPDAPTQKLTAKPEARVELEGTEGKDEQGKPTANWTLVQTSQLLLVLFIHAEVELQRQEGLEAATRQQTSKWLPEVFSSLNSNSESLAF